MMYFWTGWKDEGKSEYKCGLTTAQVAAGYFFTDRELAEQKASAYDQITVYESETDDYDYSS